MFFKKYLRKALQIQFFLLTLPPSGRFILYNLHGNQTFSVGWIYFNILSIIFLLAFVTAMVSIEER
jgi:hypothetical protein